MLYLSLLVKDCFDYDKLPKPFRDSFKKVNNKYQHATWSCTKKPCIFVNKVITGTLRKTS